MLHRVNHESLYELLNGSAAEAGTTLQSMGACVPDGASENGVRHNQHAGGDNVWAKIYHNRLVV